MVSITIQIFESLAFWKLKGILIELMDRNIQLAPLNVITLCQNISDYNKWMMMLTLFPFSMKKSAPHVTELMETV